MQTSEKAFYFDYAKRTSYQGVFPGDEICLLRLLYHVFWHFLKVIATSNAAMGNSAPQMKLANMHQIKNPKNMPQ